MKKATIIAFAVAGIVVCLSVPLLTPASEQQAIILATALVSALSAVMTMTLAILLFNRFGIEQDVLKLQFDSVRSLLGTLRTMRFWMETKDEGLLSRLQVTAFNPFPSPVFEAYYGRVVVFNDPTAEKLLSLSEHLDDIFLPASIVDTLSPLVPFQLGVAQDQKQKLTNAIHFAQREPDGTVYVQFNSAEITFMEFLSKWSDLIDAINAWVQQNAASAPVLNIRHLTKNDAQPTIASYARSAPSTSSEKVT